VNWEKARAALGAVLAIACWGTAEYVQAVKADDGIKPVQIQRKVIVRGCHQEDSCRIDYKASGVWVITKRRSR
jgi:hypothetical protein